MRVAIHEAIDKVDGVARIGDPEAGVGVDGDAELVFGRGVGQLAQADEAGVLVGQRGGLRPLAGDVQQVPVPQQGFHTREDRMTMPSMDDATRRGYETCRRMQRRHDPTYYWATRRLPPDVRPATQALYGYVRTADQIVDGPDRPPTSDARRAALDAWEQELAEPAHPVARALLDAGRRHALPLSELATYMRSMRIDCAPVRISSWDELEAYMDGSAGSVGRIMAPLLGLPSRRRHRA